MTEDYERKFIEKSKKLTELENLINEVEKIDIPKDHFEEYLYLTLKMCCKTISRKHSCMW
jgi:hypothetical protein